MLLMKYKHYYFISNIECGILFCNSPNRFPEYGGGEQSVSVTTYFIPGIGTVVCK